MYLARSTLILIVILLVIYIVMHSSRSGQPREVRRPSAIVATVP
jgi:preprotein translocase subunit SecG